MDLQENERSRPTRIPGKVGEDLACRYLEEHGYTIVERNFRAHGAGQIGKNGKMRPGKIIAELDIVARQNGTWIFVEVRSRRSDYCGTAADSITERKLAKLRLGVAFYVKKHRLAGQPIRLDAICIDFGGEVPALRHIKGIG